jgi:hypothetical protein
MSLEKYNLQLNTISLCGRVERVDVIMLWDKDDLLRNSRIGI